MDGGVQMKKGLLSTTLRKLIGHSFEMYRKKSVPVVSSAKYARQRLIELKKVC